MYISMGWYSDYLVTYTITFPYGYETKRHQIWASSMPPYNNSEVHEST